MRRAEHKVAGCGGRARRKKVNVLVVAHEERRAEELGAVLDEWGADVEVSLVGHTGLQSLLDHDADLVVVHADGQCAETAEFIGEIRKMSPWTGLVIVQDKSDSELRPALEQVGAFDDAVVVIGAERLPGAHR